MTSQAAGLARLTVQPAPNRAATTVVQQAATAAARTM
jgi:hypothetical protein